MTTTETTAPAERITTVKMGRGFNHLVLTLDRKGTLYVVGAASFYATRQGLQVEGVAERKFADLNRARTYANGWYRRLQRQGWTRKTSR
jgi:hypothetical protein